MLNARDERNNLIFAETATKEDMCFCPICKEQVKLRAGKKKIAHFAHMPKSNCPYEEDKDNMSEWHMRMQGYFPPECREYYFKDGETGEVHRADIFFENQNIVIEFQKSHISDEEFLSRTLFHLKNGRRIVWVFDESKDNAKDGDIGKLHPDDLCAIEYPHQNLSYRWNWRRSCLNDENVLPIKAFADVSNYAIFVYTGADKCDCVHRIIYSDFDYEYITLSIKNLDMQLGMDPEDFFRDEEYWIMHSDIRDSVIEYRADKQMQIELRRLAREKAERDRRNDLFRRMTGQGKRNWWL